MSWIAALLGFAIGLVVGAVLYREFKSDEAKVKLLEEQLENLEREHETYKDNVHSHFNNSAHLLNNLTESYREVYRHIAAGAQSLCPDYISEQLSHTAAAQETLTRDTFAEPGDQEIAPPRDYVDRTPDQKGMLEEDYGLDKISKSAASNSN